MNGYYMTGYTRRSNSSVIRRSSSFVGELHRTPSYGLLTRTYSTTDFHSQLQSSEAYKPKYSHTSSHLRSSWPYYILRDYKLYDSHYYDKVYNYSPVHYRYLLHNSYYLPQSSWQSNNNFPHASDYSRYKFPYRYSAFTFCNFAQTSSYNPYVAHRSTIF
ncbi:hypothetical protein DdX_11343 [Ditylenchus destructor]|uniref:Uncharacterized protein n=1 Tax=Ditylenchus destructor TaxID=166010 RepID=A0AAD4N2K6_9BILA|nr:hypothetical protein DdX_11343 [Ditylenchus destructor]